MPRRTNTCLPLLLVCLLTPGFASAEDDPLLTALTAEVERAMTELAEREPDTAPYFIALEVHDTQGVNIRGEDGALHGWSPSHRRWLDVEVRIGSRALDSTHALRKDQDFGARWRQTGSAIPLDADVELVRHLVWREIEERYAAAKERWSKVQAEARTLVDEEPAEDLTAVPIADSLTPPGVLAFPAEAWESAARSGSAVLADSPAILDGTVHYGGSVETRWFVSSEGARVRHVESRFRASVQANARADNGDDIKLFRGWEAATAAGLPGEGFILERARELSAEVDAVLAAPLEEPYLGPAILSDRAAAVFFHEVFGHRVEGHRLKQIDNAQTFRNRVGEQILPTFISVYDDPTIESAAGTDLRGHYLFDSQGVPAQRVVLVQDGVLEGFLQSRSPVEPTHTSNGHGRRQAGKDPVSRQGNLHVVTSESKTEAQLRAQLRRMAKAAGLDHGLYVDEIGGGFTFTGRTIPNAFNVNVIVGYRVFVDGRPDELVRGIDLIGTPLEAFGNIVAAGELKRVFNGNCGAESGWVPVSGVAPSLLLESVETQRKRRGQDTPPLLPPPTSDGGAS